MSDEVDLGIPGIGPATLVGRGGFGRVYRAVQASSGGAVAVKMAAGHLDATGRERFEREARAMGALRGHPNICTVFDAGVDSEGRPYLVMEYAPSTLAQRLADDGAMEWPEAAALGVQLAGALHTAHARGLLHRDVKPENVLISQFGVPKLADFGLARFTDDTLSGTITTTISHAAPELLRGGPPTVATDVYALGSTLFAALTGHVAFALTDQAHHASLYRRIEEDPVPDMPEVPDGVARVVRTAMAKDPAERPRSAEAFGEALREAQRQLGAAVTPMPLEADERARHTDPIVLVTADDATPHQGASPGELTEAVIRKDRAPVVLEEPADDLPDAARRGVPRWLPAVAVLGAVVVAVLAVALRGGDDGAETSGTTSTSDQATTTLSPDDQLAADLPLIRQYIEDWSEAESSSPEAVDFFTEHRNHPAADDLSQCPPDPQGAEDWVGAAIELDEASIERDDDFTLDQPLPDTRPDGRVYVASIRYVDPSAPDAPSGDWAPVHVAILDGAAVGFWFCT